MAKKMVRTVGFLLVKNNTFLAEKRKLTKRVDPGFWAIPGGGIFPKEKPEQALKREAREELGIQIKQFEFLGKLPYNHPICPMNMHYFVVTKWKGKIRALEAEKLEWISLKNYKKLGAKVDWQAIRLLKKPKK